MIGDRPTRCSSVSGCLTMCAPPHRKSRNQPPSKHACATSCLLGIVQQDSDRATLTLILDEVRSRRRRGVRNSFDFVDRSRRLDLHRTVLLCLVAGCGKMFLLLCGFFLCGRRWARGRAARARRGRSVTAITWRLSRQAFCKGGPACGCCGEWGVR